MGKGILRNTGKILTAVILLISVSASAAELKTELTRSHISSGESTTLKLMISGSTADIKPVTLPAVEGLKIVMSGTSRSFQFINGRSWSGITLNFTIYAEQKGSYRIPPFVVEADGERLQSSSVNLVVSEGTAAVHPSSDSGAAKGDVILSAADVYAGEPIFMRYYINGVSSSVMQVEGIKEQPSSRGFVIKQINEQNRAGGTPDSLYTASYCLIPADEGTHEIGGGSVSAIVELEDGFFSRTVRRELRFPRKKVNVKLLPAQGRPDNFHGDVGEFTIESGAVNGNFRKGDEIKIPVKVKGRGNLLTLSKPSVEKQDNIKLLIEEKEPVLSASDKDISGEKDFIVTIIPEREGECSIGSIYLTFFNPYKKVYERTATEPLSFNVSGAVQKKNEQSEDNKQDSRGTVFYILLVIAVAVAAGGAVFLFMQSKQFRAVEKKNKAESIEEPEVPHNGRNNEFLMNLESAYNSRDEKNFLLYTERFAGIIDEKKLSDIDLEEYRIIREYIHFCRYGGGSIDSVKMESIYSWMKRIIK